MHLRVAVFTLLATTQSATALDDCLLGVWDADLTDITEMLRQSDVPGEIILLGGAITAEIAADASVTALTDEIAIKVIVDGTESLMTMTGSNVGRVEADDGTFSVVIDEFDLATALIINGESMTIPATPPTTPQTSSGTYACSPTELMLTGADQGLGLQAMPQRWTRRR